MGYPKGSADPGHGPEAPMATIHPVFWLMDTGDFSEQILPQGLRSQPNFQIGQSLRMTLAFHVFGGSLRVQCVCTHVYLRTLMYVYVCICLNTCQSLSLSGISGPQKQTSVS